MAIKRKPLYEPNASDLEIFRQAKDIDPSIFTNYYMRGEQTGTWFLPGAQTKRWSAAYDNLTATWKAAGKPDYFTVAGIDYETRWEHEQAADWPDSPAFFRNHGFMFLPYQKDIFRNRKPIATIIGGFGSGKTLGMVATLLVYAAILPNFRAFALAPFSIQAEEVYKLALELITGTLYEERFLLAAPQRPFPKLVIGNTMTGISTIECYPILGNSKKLRTLTGDCAFIDQSEKLDDLKGVIRDIGTRFRGRVSKTGRGRLGTLTFVANSEDNQELWDLWAKDKTDPKNYFSLSPTSYDNIFLTDKDLHNFELQVGSSQELRDIYLLGKRPLGNGKEFSRLVQENIREPELDRVMAEGIAREDAAIKRLEDQGLDTDLIVRRFIRLEIDGPGVYEWLLPPVVDHSYMVMSDPGTKNPPDRDSGVIMVWDITGFPGSTTVPVPAKMVGFVWVFGNGTINTWATRYMELVNRYHAVLSNAHDATAYQAGYDEWLPILGGLYSEGINLGGNGKANAMNAAKVMCAVSMVKVPVAIRALFEQMGRYVYPEPLTLKQDVVITLMMSCWWLKRLFFYDDGDFIPQDDYDEDDRYEREAEGRDVGYAR